MPKPAWSWADYHRAAAREKRAAERRRAKAGVSEIAGVVAQEESTADNASGCEGRAAEVLSGPAPVEVAASPHVTVKARQSRIEPIKVDYNPRDPAPVPPALPLAPHFQARRSPSGKIDISAAPSGMEAQAERWKGKGPAPMDIAPLPILCAGEVMCRCGARANGKGRGPVPVWFGNKCIEPNCELRGAGNENTMEGA